LSKYLPLSVELRRVVTLDEASAAGVSQNLSDAVRIARQDYDRIDYDELSSGDAGRGEAGRGEAIEAAASNTTTTESDSPPFVPDNERGEDPGDAEKPARKRGRQFTSPGDENAEETKEAAPAPAKVKPLYQQLRARIAEAGGFEALNELADEIKGLEAGEAPERITEANRAVLLASIGRKRQELQ
jgi:hypothetical protein